MDTGTLIYIISMGFTVLIFGGITYLFTKKQDFSLLSGFSNRPDEDKDYLEKSGYLRALSTIFKISFWLLFITFILGFFPIPLVFEIGMGVFIIYLMIGLVWIQRYEVPHQKKKMFWITSVLSTATIGFIIVVSVIGFSENEVTITEDSLVVSGIYGDEWPLTDVQEVHLMDELPKVIVRTNGFAISGILKGHFNLEEPYGGSLLFIQKKGGPYLLITTTDETIFLNRKQPEETKKMYQELQ